MYIKIFNNTNIKGQLGDEIESYSVVSIPYNKQQLINSFSDYHDEFSIIKYKEIIYNKHITHINSENGKNKKGKTGNGKIQQWVNNLSNSELKDIKNDINNLSIRKFQSKWNKDKRLVVKYINEQ